MNTFISLIANFIITVVIAMPLNIGAATDDVVLPEDVAKDFLTGVSSCSLDATSAYLDNDYILYLVNAEGDEDVMARRNEALFQDFTYEIVDSAQKNNVAVVKVKISNANFADVLTEYESSSEDYIMENLYSDEVTDKDKLSAKCLDLYVSEIEEAASSNERNDYEIFISMVKTNSGWSVNVDDSLMEKILGNLELPEKEGD